MPRTTSRHRSLEPRTERPLRSAPTRRRPSSRRRVAVACAAGAVATAGVAVGLQVVDGSSDVALADAPTGTLPTSTPDDGTVSRSSERPMLSESALDVADQGSAAAVDLVVAKKKAAEKKRKEAERQERIDDAIADPRGAAQAMLAEFGWDASQMSCLDALWNRESGWNYQAENPSSGAYGIPQSLPGSKMGTVASDWRENPLTQIRWGLQYIQASYGSPCGADSHSQSVGHY